MKISEVIVIIIHKDTDAINSNETIKNRYGIATVVDKYIYKSIS